MSTDRTISRQLAAFADALEFGDIPAPVREHACLQLMDTVGVARAAARTNAAPAVERVASSAPSSERGGPVIGQGRAIDLPLALLANGTLSHALDFDNTHTASMVHVGAAVGPTALTLGASLGAPGQEVIRAYVAGVECAARLGGALPGAFHRRGFHATSVIGIFGALVAGASLAHASPEQLVNAMGIAGSLAAGLLEYHNAGSQNKQLHPGLLARDAYVALQLALAGAEGPESVFEGPFGLFATHLGEVPASFGTGSLGQLWETSEVTTKPYPACNLVHFAMDCLEQIGRGFDVADVRSVVVRGPEEIVPLVVEPHDAKLAPRNAYEAKFSIQHCVGRHLVDGELRVDSFTPSAVSDTRVAELAEKVVFHPSEDLSYPARLGGSVQVCLADGQVLFAEVGDAKGSPGRPLSAEAIVAKFVANAAPREQAVLARDLAERLLAMATLDDVGPLIAECATASLFSDDASPSTAGL